LSEDQQQWGLSCSERQSCDAKRPQWKSILATARCLPRRDRWAFTCAIARAFAERTDAVDDVELARAMRRLLESGAFRRQSLHHDGPKLSVASRRAHNGGNSSLMPGKDLDAVPKIGHGDNLRADKNTLEGRSLSYRVGIKEIGSPYGKPLMLIRRKLFLARRPPSSRATRGWCPVS
jgi:hypothetical protein